MIVVTGGAGFIGSNLVAALNADGRDDILVVDDLTDGRKFRNIADLAIADYQHKDEFLAAVEAGHGLDDVEVVYHLGACSKTTEWDGRYIMANNYRYTLALLDACTARKVPLIYASSAAVYGGSATFEEDPAYELPLNPYGYSKLLFDQILRRRFDANAAGNQVVGLRFFNVYGPREQHKDSMASVAFHFHNQLATGDTVRLFEGTDGYANGEQRRDFVYVGDVVKVMRWFGDNPAVSGIYNVGTGSSSTFNDVANAVIAHHGRGRLDYIPFPDHLKGAYQSFTQADLSQLRAAGCDVPFCDVATGVKRYLTWLDQR